MSCETEIKLIETTSTEVKNRLLAPDEILRVIDKGAFYINGPGGKPCAIVVKDSDGQMKAGGEDVAVGAGLTVEQAQDAAAALFTSGTHSGITFTYDDAGNRMNATVTAVGGGGDTWITRKVTLTANSQTVTLVISGYGTTAVLNAVTVVYSVDGASSMVLTLGNMSTFKLRNVSVNVPAGANAGPGITVVAPDPSGATGTNLADSALANMTTYNDAGATVAATLVSMSLAGGALSVQKTGLTAGSGYRFKIVY